MWLRFVLLKLIQRTFRTIAHCVRAARGWAFALIVFGTSIFGNYIVTLFLPMITLFDRHRQWRKMMDRAMTFWMLIPLFFLHFVFRVRMRATGDLIRLDEPAIIIMNHRTRLDWFYFWLVLWAMNPWLMTRNRIALKQLLRHVPGAGFGMQGMMYVFMKRDLHADQARMSRVVDYYADMDMDIFIFYAGFEMQPKHYKQPLIAILNIELELKAEKDNAELRIGNVADYQEVVNAEWTILYDKLQKIYDSGAKIVLSKLPIGDVATQWFADRDMFCAGRVQEEDLNRVIGSCGGSTLTTVTQIDQSMLGQCAEFYEQQVGSERYNFFIDGSKAKSCTLILRGGSEQFIAETERSLHDAIMIVRRAMKNDTIVAGGGAIEMEMSKYILGMANNREMKDQFFWKAYAKAFEIIPQQLCQNAGLDAISLLGELRAAHVKGQKWVGIDIQKESVADNMEGCIWEPALVKENAIISATEAACLVLSIDQTIKNPKSKNEMPGLPGQPGM